jgi:hypothetical protein
MNGFIASLSFSHRSTISVHSNTDAAGSESVSSVNSDTCAARSGTASFSLRSKLLPGKRNQLRTFILRHLLTKSNELLMIPVAHVVIDRLPT